MATVKEIAAAARRIVEDNPDHPARGLARMLVQETNRALTMEQARSRIRYALGVKGGKARKWATAPRPPRQAGQKLAMPASVAEPWVPHVLEVTGRVGIMSDVHVPYHDEVAVQAAVDHIGEAGVSAILLNGDICDFYSISRWDKDPSKRDFSGELTACREFLAWLREQFPTIPIVLKAGNHEERFNHYIFQHAPELSKDRLGSLPAWLHLEQHGIQYVDDQRPVLVGKLPVLHGHELPRGISSPVNPARGAWMRTKSSVLQGHQHQTSGHSEPNMWHEETFCWSTGCLCDLTPEFSRVNRWNHGAAIVTVHEGGEYDVENFRISAGKVRQS